MGKHVLVTGASGFLGSQLVKHLGQKPDLLVTALAGRKDLWTQLENLKGPFDAIIHAGFQVDFGKSNDAASGESDNLKSTRQIAEFAKKHKVPHFIFLSAAGALGVSRTPQIRNEDNLGATDEGFEGYRNSRYIREKIACEPILKDCAPTVTILYLTTVYGNGMCRTTRNTLLKVRKGNPLVVCPPGGTSYLSLEDFLSAVDAVLDKRPGGGFVISSGNVRYAGLFQQAARSLHVSYRKKVVLLPNETIKAVRAAQDLLPGKFITASVIESAFGFKYYSPEKARLTFGWRPRATLETMLNDTLTH